MSAPIEIPGFAYPGVAGADLSSKQYFFGAIAADGQIDPAGDGVAADGVIANNPDTAGQPCNLTVSGVSPISAGEALTVGMFLASDANGQAVEATSGDYIMGKCVGAAGAANELGSILLTRPGRLA